MARVQNPIIGRASGSLGNTVFTTYLERNVIKSKPIEVKPSNTPAQANQRALLKKVSGIVRDLSASTGIAKRSARTGRNPKNTAKAALAGAIFARVTGTSPNRQLSGEGIALVGNGIAPIPRPTVVVDASDSEVTVTWDISVPTGGDAGDQFACSIVNLETGAVHNASVLAFRSSGSCNFTCPAGFVVESKKYAIFPMFNASDGISFDSIVSVEATAIA